MLGNPLIKFEKGVAKARTDLQATHYYKDKDNEKTTLWGYYDTHMVKKTVLENYQTYFDKYWFKLKF